MTPQRPHKPQKPEGQARAGPGKLVYATFRDLRPAVMVISHERSGTHFLMNSVARAYGYTTRPHIDFDLHRMPVNFFHPQTVFNALNQLANERIASIVKSHHAVEFFDGVLDDILRRYIVFYIHRHPVPVMVSYWRFINHWPWREGPRRSDPVAFARAEPEGQLLRYQMRQRRNMLDRWARHVEGWVAAAKGRPRLRVVRYDELKDDYPAAIRRIGDLFGAEPADLTPPPPDVNVVRGTNDPVSEADMAALRALAASEVGDTMKRLGYA